jgi:replicative DNA helicase
MTLSNSVPTAANIAHYAEIIVRKATLRKLISASTEIAGMGLIDPANRKVRWRAEASSK